MTIDDFSARVQRLLDAVRTGATLDPADQIECFYERSDRADVSLSLRPGGRLTDRRRLDSSRTLDEGISLRHVDVDPSSVEVMEGFDLRWLAPRFAVSGAPMVHPWGIGDDALPSEASLRQTVEDAVSGFDGISSAWRISAGIRAVVRRTLVVTSAGRAAWSIQPSIMLRVDVGVGRSNDEWRATAVGSILAVDGGLDMDEATRIGMRAVDTAAHRRGAVVPRAGAQPVVLASGWNGIWLHEAVGHLLEADVFRDGPFSGAEGRIVAPPSVTVVDDPHSVSCDDEGTATSPTTLIDRGRFVAVMTDGSTSALTGHPLSGNGRRQDFRHPPLPRQWGVRLLPGDVDSSDLSLGIRNGVFVEGARRARSQLSGAFELQDAWGFAIEDGRLTAPIAGFDVCGDAASALRAIEAISAVPSEGRWWGDCVKRGQRVQVSVQSPALRFRELTVRA